MPSAPIVVKNDPTLLFTNAGMNQFKDYFLGNKKAEYPRVADTQKCLRVSGKHNDLEEVGVDTYHHTMFEMLGNWSFGDYFKKEAIAWSWELLTEVYKIDKDRIYVTVFGGDDAEGLPLDDEAMDEWRKWVPEARILKGSKKDNFWEMGDTGPCGPCSEIHVDCRPEAERLQVPGDALVNADHPQVIEVWNNVFMEFNRLKDGSLQPLPSKHVDTGMGFERLVRVLQQKNSNYDTDVFSGTIAMTEGLTGQHYDGGDSKKAVAFRVLADHIRAIGFTIADGQLPSNTGAGYVIRRILRRAVRYYYSYLDYKQPLLFQLLPVIAQQFADVFPELVEQQDFVVRVVREEEEAFLRTLEKGIRRFEDYYAQQLRAMGSEGDPIMGVSTADVWAKVKEQGQMGVVIDGKFAFELNDTYGFPLDLTSLMAQEVNAVVDEPGFEAEMLRQKERSRAATNIDTEDWVRLTDTDQSSFVGYDDLLIETRVSRYRKVKAKGKEQYQLVLESTPFYAESGGQVGDKGVLDFSGEEIPVEDTKKENDLIVHFTSKLPSAIDGPVVAKVDWEHRILTTYNHTATHLLHAALRQVLGTHVAQKGSLVSSSVLRFDFSHFAKMTDEEIRAVERIVNERIRANIPVTIRQMPKEEALALGAMALFGEKYGDTVRTVTIDPGFSVELCGGTHVGNTGMIGVFAIVSESAVAAGVRRIEAVTGPGAIRYFADKVSQNKQITELLKTKDPLKAIEKMMEEKAELEKRLERLEARQLATIREELTGKAEALEVSATGGGKLPIHLVAAIVDVPHADALKKLCFDFKGYLPHYVVVLATALQGKAHVAIAIDDALVAGAGLDAGALIKNVVAPIIKGGGGGQKGLATAGGQETGHLDKVLDAVRLAVLS